MLHSERAVISLAVLSLKTLMDCIFVARITVVSVSCTEEESNGAAVSTLEVDKFVTMRLAIGYTSTNHVSCALGTDAILLSEVSGPHGIILTVCHASEVRLLALEARIE